MDTVTVTDSSLDLENLVINTNVLRQIENCVAEITIHHEKLNREFSERITSVMKKEIEKNLTRKTERRRFKKKEYDFISNEKVGEISKSQSELLTKEILGELGLIKRLGNFDSFLENKLNPSYSTTNLNRLLGGFESNTEVFLKYFFATPRSEVKFGYHEIESFYDFIKSRDVSAISEIENMFLIPPILDEKQVDFYLQKSMKKSSQYFSLIKDISQNAVSTFEPRVEAKHTEIDDYLEMDLNILKSGITKINEKPHSIQTGIYTIQSVIAMRRIDSKVCKIMDSLQESINNLNTIPDFSKDNLSEMGFEKILKKPGYWDVGCGFHIGWGRYINPKK